MEERDFEPLAQELLKIIPEYRSEYDDDVSYYGEFIPITFFGISLVRFCLVLFRKWKHEGDSEAFTTLKQVIDFVEQGLASDDEEIVDLFYFHFLECVSYAEKDYDEFVLLFSADNQLRLEDINKGWRP